jgi:hypothetical protein
MQWHKANQNRMDCGDFVAYINKLCAIFRVLNKENVK